MKKHKFYNKILFIILSLVFSLSLALKGQIPWNDDFETYNAGAWPTNWVADGNATNISSNYIDNAISFQGSKSLRLHGVVAGCWGALAYHPVSVNTPFEVEVIVRNGNEGLSGCHPDRAGIGLRQGTSWSNPARTFVVFKNDGTIESGGGSVSLGTYSTLKWYTVRIRYERHSPSLVKLSYWINGIFKGYEVLEDITDEDQLDNLELQSGEGTVWFDNVSFGEIVGLSEKLEKEELAVYPNPFKKRLFINSEGKNPKIIEIYDLAGRIVHKEIFESPTDVSHLQNGMYILFAKDVNGEPILFEKITKE